MGGCGKTRVCGGREGREEWSDLDSRAMFRFKQHKCLMISLHKLSCVTVASFHNVSHPFLKKSFQFQAQEGQSTWFKLRHKSMSQYNIRMYRYPVYLIL